MLLLQKRAQFPATLFAEQQTCHSCRLVLSPGYPARLCYVHIPMAAADLVPARQHAAAEADIGASPLYSATRVPIQKEQ